MISYDKFPGININNISLIKRDSLHSDAKFFIGSLDMRYDLLNHEDQVASVRLANKKLIGFERAESSDEDNHDGMIMEVNETVMSRDINRIQTPNLEPHDLNFSEYVAMKEKTYEPEEEKLNYPELFENAQNAIDGLKRDIDRKDDEIEKLKQEIDVEIYKYEEKLRGKDEEIKVLEKNCNDKENIIEEYKAKLEESLENKQKVEKKMDKMIENWEKIKEESDKSELSLNK